MSGSTPSFNGLIRFFLLLGLVWPTLGLRAAEPPYDKPFDVPVAARVIDRFLPSQPEKTVFGKLEFLGGLELVSSNEHFGGYSGFRFLDGQARFVAISDLGFWLVGEVQRKAGRLSGVINARAAPIRGLDGKLLPGKWSADAEGLELIGNTALVTFERNHRVEFHTLDLEHFNGTRRPFPARFSDLGLRGNKGLEAVVAIPKDLNLDFEYLFFAERSLDRAGNLRAFLLSKGRLRQFTIVRDKDFDITSAALLPDGRLIVLERRYNLANGVALRLRQFALADIAPGKLVDGTVLMEADMAHQIDNFEGLDVSLNGDGDTVLTLISDDNHFILQRTLLLEFRLLN